MAKKKPGPKPAAQEIDVEGLDYTNPDDINVFNKVVQLQNKALLDRFMVVGENQTHIIGMINLIKPALINMTNILETVMARIDSLGNVVASQAAPMVPASSIYEEYGNPPAVATPQAVQPVQQAPMGASGHNGLVSIPNYNPVRNLNTGIQDAVNYQPIPQVPIPPVAQAAPTQQKAAATRLSMDGAIERGTAPPDKKYIFVNVMVTPTEITQRALKVVFQYTDKDGYAKKSWDARYNSAEVWLSKSLISPDSMIKRLQVQQPVLAVNWWLAKNSIPM